MELVRPYSWSTPEVLLTTKHPPLKETQRGSLPDHFSPIETLS